VWRPGCSVQADSTIESGIDDEPPQVELHRGHRGCLRAVESGGGLTTVSLELLEAHGATSRRDRAEAQLYNVIEWLEEGVVIFDAKHGIQTMNSRFVQIAGLAPEKA
jgi:hypothetical protein